MRVASRGDEQNLFHRGAGDEPGDERSASGGNLGSSEWEYRAHRFSTLAKHVPSKYTETFPLADISSVSHSEAKKRGGTGVTVMI